MPGELALFLHRVTALQCFRVDGKKHGIETATKRNLQQRIEYTSD
jgi:hypothetical protein